MPSISALPTELVVFVLDNLDRLSDVAALARINQRLYNVVNPILYKRAVSQNCSYPLEWAAHHGVVGTLNRALDSGADPNYEFQQCSSSKEWEKSLAGDGQLHQGCDAATVCHSSITLLAGSNGTSHGFENIENEDETMSDYTDDDGGNYTDHEPDYYSPTLGDDYRGNDSESSGRWNEEKYDRRYTALHLAARAGHIDAISTLLQRGARSDVVAKRFCSCWREHGLLNAMEGPRSVLNLPGWTPLHVAICHSKEEAAIKLLEKGAPIQMELSPTWEKSGYCENPATALHHAAAMGLVHVVRYLVDTGLQSEIDVRDNKTLTPLYYAYAYSQWDFTLPLLLKLGANIDIDVDIFLPYSTITPVGEACRLGRYEDADKLIDLGADVNRGYIATNVGKGLTPLHMCAMPPAKGTQIPALGAGRATRGTGGYKSPEEEYATAVKLGSARVSTIQKLVARGADLEKQDCPGDTPLTAAVQNLNVPAVRALIKAGANIHATTSLGRNVLMQAIEGPQLPTPSSFVHLGMLSRVLRELLNNGARIDHTDNQGNTLLHVICKCTKERATPELQHQVLRLVLNIPGAAALMQVRETRESLTPLMVAFTGGKLLCCDVLVRRGCWDIDPEQKRKDLTRMFQYYHRHRSYGNYNEILLDYLMDLDIDGHLATDEKFGAHILFDNEYAHRQGRKYCFDSHRPHTATGERLYDRSNLLRGQEEPDEDVLGAPPFAVKAWCAMSQTVGARFDP